MANWLHKLDLTDIWKKYSNVEVYDHADELGKVVAERLRKLNLPKRYQDKAEDLAVNFENVEDLDEFNNWMDALYDLGDTQISGDFLTLKS